MASGPTREENILDIAKRTGYKGEIGEKARKIEGRGDSSKMTDREKNILDVAKRTGYKGEIGQKAREIEARYTKTAAPSVLMYSQTIRPDPKAAPYELGPQTQYFYYSSDYPGYEGRGAVIRSSYSNPMGGGQVIMSQEEGGAAGYSRMTGEEAPPAPEASFFYWTEDRERGKSSIIRARQGQDVLKEGELLFSAPIDTKATPKERAFATYADWYIRDFLEEPEPPREPPPYPHGFEGFLAQAGPSQDHAAYISSQRFSLEGLGVPLYAIDINIPSGEGRALLSQRLAENAPIGYNFIEVQLDTDPELERVYYPESYLREGEVLKGAEYRTEVRQKEGGGTETIKLLSFDIESPGKEYLVPDLMSPPEVLVPPWKVKQTGDAFDGVIIPSPFGDIEVERPNADLVRTPGDALGYLAYKVALGAAETKEKYVKPSEGYTFAQDLAAFDKAVEEFPFVRDFIRERELFVSEGGPGAIADKAWYNFVFESREGAPRNIPLPAPFSTFESPFMRYIAWGAGQTIIEFGKGGVVGLMSMPEASGKIAGRMVVPIKRIADAGILEGEWNLTTRVTRGQGGAEWIARGKGEPIMRYDRIAEAAGEIAGAYGVYPIALGVGAAEFAATSVFAPEKAAFSASRFLGATFATSMLLRGVAKSLQRRDTGTHSTRPLTAAEYKEASKWFETNRASLEAGLRANEDAARSAYVSGFMKASDMRKTDLLGDLKYTAQATYYKTLFSMRSKWTEATAPKAAAPNLGLEPSYAFSTPSGADIYIGAIPAGIGRQGVLYQRVAFATMAKPPSTVTATFGGLATGIVSQKPPSTPKTTNNMSNFIRQGNLPPGFRRETSGTRSKVQVSEMSLDKVFPRGRTSGRSRSWLNVRQDAIEAERYGPVELTAEGPIVRTRTGRAVQARQVPRVRIRTLVGTRARTWQRVRTRQATFEVVVPPVIVPGGDRQRDIRQGRKKETKKKKKKRYAKKPPDFFAAEQHITGKVPRGALQTAIGVRPVTRGWMGKRVRI